jgi:hypothetical protein
MKKFLLSPVLGLVIFVSCLAMTTPASAFMLYNYNSRLCLDVPALGFQGTFATQTKCNSNTLSQQWFSNCVHGFCITDGTGGVFGFINYFGTALGVAGSNQQNGYNTVKNGTRLVAWNQTGGWDQAWGFQYVFTDPSLSPFGTYGNRCFQVENGVGVIGMGTWVMGVAAGSKAPGAQVMIWTNLGNPDQIWCLQ